MIMVVVYVQLFGSHDTGLKPDLINDISFRRLAGWLTCEKSLTLVTCSGEMNYRCCVGSLD